MKTDIQNEKAATTTNSQSEQTEIKRLSLNIRSSIKGGTFAMRPCKTLGCHC